MYENISESMCGFKVNQEYLEFTVISALFTGKIIDWAVIIDCWMWNIFSGTTNSLQFIIWHFEDRMSVS